MDLPREWNPGRIGALAYRFLAYAARFPGMSEQPPENPRPLFADEELAPRRPLAVPGATPDPVPDASPLPPEYYTDPPPSRKPLGVAVVILAVLVLVLGGTAGWALMSSGSKTSDLNAQLASANSQLTAANSQIDTLNSQVTDLQGQLDTATQSGTDQTKQITKLTKKVKTLRQKVKAAIQTSDLPAVAYLGTAGKKLKAQFQQQLIGPMTSAATGAGDPLLSLVITIPVNDGDPYTYDAVYANGVYHSAQYGTKGSALPAWTVACDSGGCA